MTAPIDPVVTRPAERRPPDPRARTPRSVDSPIVLQRLRATQGTTSWLVAAAVLGALVGIPLLVSGPGNDLDVGNVFRSGRSIARHLDYVPSRAPGSPVHEAIVGVADLLGGPLLANLTSLVAAAVLVVTLDRLLRDEGLGPGRRWAVAVVVANPWFLIAATSSTDYLFGLAFVLLAARALRADRTVLAGVLGGLAMGCRVGVLVLVAALLLAELGDDDRAAAIRRAVTTGLVFAAVTLVLFVPAFLHADGFAFAQNDFRTAGPLVHLGRAAVKNLTLLGPLASLVALAALPAVIGAIRGWRTSWLVRFAVPGLVLSQILFIRFPWKVPHLLPCLLCGAILLAVALRDRPKLLMVLVALQLLFGVFRIDVVRPDAPGQATSGEPALSVGWGPVVTDWQCRRQHPEAYQGRQRVEVEAAWNCARPFGTGPR